MISTKPPIGMSEKYVHERLKADYSNVMLLDALEPLNAEIDAGCRTGVIGMLRLLS